MTNINLISGPRNISTAFMYSFAQRSDTKVFDEPFYSVYLTKSNADHPGKEEVIKALPKKENDVRKLISEPSGKKVHFIKNMAHHMEVLDEPFIEGAHNVFLIRDPLQIITSYSQVIERPVMRDIGIEYQYKLFEQQSRKGKTPIVIDSGLLLEGPRSVLIQLCERCGLHFEEKMLSWEAGPKSYDGVWAPHWYANVHRSTGFAKQRSEPRTLPKDLQPLYEESRSLYEKLLPIALKP